MIQSSKLSRKVVALILAVVVTLGCLPLMAMAASDDIAFVKTYSVTANGDGSANVTASYQNQNQTEKSITAKLEILGDGVITGKKEITKTVAAGSTKTISWTVKAHTGSTKLFVSSKENGVITTEKVGSVSSDKAGWISGDIHDHTKYSDGSGTIDQNFARAQNVGMDYINISDHSNSKGWPDAQIAGAKYDVLPIWGNEYTHRSYAHAVFMNVNQEKNYSALSPWTAVETFKNDTNGQGLAYIAHPYDGSGKTADPWTTNVDAAGQTAWNLAPVDGIEVWNGWYAANYTANLKARAKWDELNNAGRHLYGVADTDTHSTLGIGEVYTTVDVKENTAAGILDGYRAGHMYGTNGPVIDFKIGRVMMGDDMAVPAKGKTVKVDISGNYIEDLARVLIIKNGVTIYTKDINAKSFKEEVKVSVKPGDFIRMEVEGKETETKKLTNGSYSTASYFTSAPFAFSNPIFFSEFKPSDETEHEDKQSTEVDDDAAEKSNGDE